MDLEKIPSKKELKSLLGIQLYKYYFTLTSEIVSKLYPDLETWDKAGRRGKYYHGYQVNSKLLLLDFYLSNVNNGQVKYQLKLKKASFNKILKKRDSFSEIMNQNLMWSEDFYKEYGEIYLNTILNEETINDSLRIIEIIS